MRRNFLRTRLVLGICAATAICSSRDVLAQDYDYRAPSYYVVPPTYSAYSLYAPTPIGVYAPAPVVVAPAPVLVAPVPVAVAPAPVYYAAPPVYAPAYPPVVGYRPVPFSSVTARWHTGPLGVSHYHYRYNTPVGHYRYNYNVRGGWGW